MKITMIKCDRCGHIFDEQETVTMRDKIIPLCDPNQSRSMDFCVECTKSFDAMIRSSIENWLNKPITIEVEQQESIKEEPEKSVEVQTSCEERCYQRRIDKNDFKRCAECGRLSKCPAISDDRCNSAITTSDIENPKGKKAMTKDHGGSHFMWTDKELKFLKDNYDKLSINEIAYQLGRSYGSVGGKLSLMGLKKKGTRGSFRTSWEDWEIDLLKEEGSSNTLDELSKLFDNHTKESIRRMMYALDIKWKGKRAYNKKSSS